MEKEKGKFRNHFRKSIRHLFLWTSQMNPQAFFKALKNDVCFSYNAIIFEKIEESEDKQKYKVTFDFGDLAVEYEFVFGLSKVTERWVLSEII